MSSLSDQFKALLEQGKKEKKQVRQDSKRTIGSHMARGVPVDHEWTMPSDASSEPLDEEFQQERVPIISEMIAEEDQCLYKGIPREALFGDSRRTLYRQAGEVRQDVDLSDPVVQEILLVDVVMGMPFARDVDTEGEYAYENALESVAA